MADNKPAFCFIGFGEAGQAVAAGLREEGVARIAAWDILFPQAKGEELKRAADAIGVRAAELGSRRRAWRRHCGLGGHRGSER